MFILGVFAGITVLSILIWIVRYLSKRVLGELVAVPDELYPKIVKGAERLVSRELDETTYRIKGYDPKKKKALVLIYSHGFGHPTRYHVNEYGKAYAVGSLQVRSSEVDAVKSLVKSFHGRADDLRLPEVLARHLGAEYSIEDIDVKRTEYEDIFNFSVKAEQEGATNLYEVDLDKGCVTLLSVTWSFRHGEVVSALGRT